MAIAHINPETQEVEYSESVGTGTSPATPHRGKSIIQNGELVDETNPLHAQDVELAGRIGGKSDAAATSDDASASLIALFKRGLQRWSAMVAALGATTDGAAASDTATASQIGLFKRSLQHLAGILAGVGAPADAAASTDSGTASLLALIKRGLGSLSTVVARLPASGVATESTQATVSANIGSALDSEATGNGSAIAILKRLRTLLLGRGKLVQAKLAPVASTTVAYTAGDALGGLQFVDSLALEAGDGLLAVSAKAVVVPAGFAFDLIVFDAAPTVSPVDNEPYNVAFATHPSVAAWYVFDGSTTYERVLDGTNTNTRAQKPNPTLSSDPNEVIIPSTGRGLWFVFIARTTQSTPFSNVSDIIATVSFSRA